MAHISSTGPQDAQKDNALSLKAHLGPCALPPEEEYLSSQKRRASSSSTCPYKRHR